MRLILLGLPGAGKGTQAHILAERLGLLHISTGDMFREAAANRTELGLKAQEFMNKGQLVPDEVTIGMLLERIAQPDAEKGIMLDGFPRTIPQAEALDRALEERGSQIDAVLYIEVPEDQLMARLTGRWTCPTCGARADQPAEDLGTVRQRGRGPDAARRRPSRDGEGAPGHEPRVDRAARQLLRGGLEAAPHRGCRRAVRHHRAFACCDRNGTRRGFRGVD